jgi:hypothetical protein
MTGVARCCAHTLSGHVGGRRRAEATPIPRARTCRSEQTGVDGWRLATSRFLDYPDPDKSLVTWLFAPAGAIVGRGG